MNKLLIFAVLVLFLTGCGGNEMQSVDSDNQEETAEQPAEKEETSVDTEEPETNENTFSDETGTFTINGVYTNENSDPETSFYEMDFDGFKLNIKPYFVDLEVSPEMQMEEKYHGRSHVKAILLETKTENTNDFEMTNQGSSFTVVTSDGEQLDVDTSLMTRNDIMQSYYGGVKEEGYFVVPIEGETAPESIKVIVEPPYKLKDGAVDLGNGKMGEEQQVDFKYAPIE